MRSSARLALCMLAACSNAPLATTLTSTSPSPAPDVFQCARDQLKALRFDQTSVDVDARRVTARRFDDKARRPDVQFRRMVDRIEVEAVPSEDGATQLEVLARLRGVHHAAGTDRERGEGLGGRAGRRPDRRAEVQPAGGFHLHPGLAFADRRTIRDSGE